MEEYYVLAYCAGYKMERYAKSADRQTVINDILIKLAPKLDAKCRSNLPTLIAVHENSHSLGLSDRKDSLTIYCVKDNIEEIDLKEIKDLGVDPGTVVKFLARLIDWIGSNGYKHPKTLEGYSRIIKSTRV